jgi:hypothetical protein
MATYYLDFEGGDDYRSEQGPYDRGLLSSQSMGTDVAGRFGGAANFAGGNTSAAIFTSTSLAGIAIPASTPFCLEIWGQFTSNNAAADQTAMGFWSSSTGNLGWRLGTTSSGQLALQYTTDGTTIITVGGAYTPTLNTWVHLCAERDASNVIKVYAAGVQIATATDSSAFFTSTLGFVIGNINGLTNAKFPGYVDSCRVTIGSTRYGAAFTPPSGEFPTYGVSSDSLWNYVSMLYTLRGDGTGNSFTNRWRTFLNGATAARIAPNDTIRLMGSKDPTSLGQSATWTNGSANITLASAVTQLIDDGESSWTASANVTCTTSATRRSGSTSSSIAIAAGFTTGKVAFKATASTLDLSPYQQATYWIRPNAAVATNTLSLRLCSDTAGVTTVNTLKIPALPAANVWYPITVDTAAALGASIQSVALYADLDPGTVTVLLDNINAAKAASSADALTLNSLIGKAHVFNWVASTAYSLNDIRIPTTTHRTGYCYKVTTAGTTGSNEPTWPEYIGGTVTDGSVVWTALETADTWYPIAVLNGTTVTLSSLGATGTTSASYRGYGGATETVLTYKREPILPGQYGSATSGTENNVTDSGSASGLITYSGGWDRTAMTTQSGETWLTYGNGRGGNSLQAGSNATYIAVEYFGTVRALGGIFPQSGAGALGLWKFTGVSVHDSADIGFGNSSSNQGDYVMKDCHFWGNLTHNLSVCINSRHDLRRCQLDGSGGAGAISSTNGAAVVRAEECWMRQNTTYGVYQNANGCTWTLFGCGMSGNSTADVRDLSYSVKMHNCNLGSSTEFDTALLNVISNGFTFSGKNDQTAGNHKTVGYGVTVTSDTSTVHTALSWKFAITTTNRNQFLPVLYPLAQLAVRSGTTYNISIWHRRSSTNIQGTLRVRGGQLNGVPEQSVSLAPTINTWVQSGNITITPTEDGVIEVEVLVWDGVGTTNNFWVDDLTVV